MPKNEDGEFELILGNRQLLSVFFIVAILIGVFFTMGYIVGRNSAPGITADIRKNEKPPAVETSRPEPTANPAEQQPAAAPLAADTGPVGAAAEAHAKTLEQPPAQSPAAPKPAETAQPDTGRAASMPEEPAPGSTYLQVAAVQRAEAELFVDVLAKKGFHSLYAPVPDNANMFRVLVGPFKDPSAIAQARADLEKAGFKGFSALVRKY